MTLLPRCLLAAAFGLLPLLVPAPTVRAADIRPAILLANGSVQLRGNVARMLEKAERRGWARVIVGVGDAALLAPARSREEVGHKQLRRRAAQAALMRQLAAMARGRGAVAAATVAEMHAFETVPFVALKLPAALLRQLVMSPLVGSVEEDELARPTLDRSVPMINADDAWRLGATGRGTVVAVLDTGVDGAHPMLAGKIVAEACYSTPMPGVAVSLCPGLRPSSTEAGSGRPCSASITFCFHGTHVASVAAGNGPNLKGVARDAGLIAIQVFSRFDDPFDCWPDAAPCVRAAFSDIQKGLERVYALRQRHTIAAVNLSLGGGGLFATSCDDDHPALKAVVDNLRSAGIATVTAAGNNGVNGQVTAPACISSVIAVAASTQDDQVTTFSDLSHKVALLAPGAGINAAVPGGGLRRVSGTSQATPHVAGAFAILRQTAPGLKVWRLLEALTCTGEPVTRAGITKPRLDVLAATNRLKKPRAPCHAALPATT